MNTLMTGTEAQPEFPAEDLTDKNAEALELMMANLQIVQDMHTVAERHAWAFRVGHPAVVAGAVDCMMVRISEQ